MFKSNLRFISHPLVAEKPPIFNFRYFSRFPGFLATKQSSRNEVGKKNLTL